MKKVVKVQQNDAQQTTITWLINNICKNSCSYCPSMLHSGSNHNYDWDNARRFVLMLLERYPKINLSIAGGEPTMSPFLIELVKLFYDAGHSVGITTNGAKSPEYWKEISKYLDYVCFSWHSEAPNDRFFENIRAASTVTQTTCRVMMLGSKWDECVAAYNKLIVSPYYLTSAVRIVDWGTNNNTHYYTPDQLQWFETTAKKTFNKPLAYKNKINKVYGSMFYFDDDTNVSGIDATSLINQGQTNFLGYECFIGINSLFVGIDGKIKRGNCSAGDWIGHINDPDNIAWPTGPIICPIQLCSCVADVIINKQSLDPAYHNIIDPHKKIIKFTPLEVQQQLGHLVIPHEK
jgi:organic radical activating enzyme